MEYQNSAIKREVVGRKAPLITLVSASGGVGKSAIALIIAHLTARAQIQTAIVEGDLQFGDMGFWLGLDTSLSNLSQGAGCIPITISKGLSLYKAPVLPEVAEEVADEVFRMVPTVQGENELVIADTGQFWSRLTAELVISSDLVLLIMDQRESSIYGAIKARELISRLGVPSAHIACIGNRCTAKPKSEAARIRDAVGCDEAFCLCDGKSSVEALIGTGRIEELVESGSAPIPDAERMLADLLPRIGLSFKPSAHKKGRGLFS